MQRAMNERALRFHKSLSMKMLWQQPKKTLEREPPKRAMNPSMVGCDACAEVGLWGSLGGCNRLIDSPLPSPGTCPRDPGKAQPGQKRSCNAGSEAREDRAPDG